MMGRLKGHAHTVRWTKTSVSVPHIGWQMAKPETIRQAIEATQRELASGSGSVRERERIRERLESLEHALRMSR